MATKQNIEIDSEEFLLANVNLEAGFEFNQNVQVIGTETSLFDIHIAEGKIKEIAKRVSIDQNELDTIDGQEFLMLPSLRDMHIHIDKTYYGGGALAQARSRFLSGASNRKDL